MMQRSLGIIVLATVAGAGGCLQKETTHTIYLTPDGKASWMAEERDVRSDESDPARRLAEEQRYILAVAADDHGIARGLAALDPIRLGTHVVRNQRPFVVITQAEFASLEFAARRMLMQLDLRGDVVVTRRGPVTTLTVRIDVAAAEEASGPDTPVVDLFDDLDCYRFVLTEGRFVGATGFTVLEGGAVAVPIETSQETIAGNGGILELSLSWE
jgi:protein involved in polysaccharide export with SLBB domain